MTYPNYPMHLKILFLLYPLQFLGGNGKIMEDPNSGNEEMWFNFEALAAGYP
jgi:hypothetical protein